MSVQRPLGLKYLCVARILNARPLPGFRSLSPLLSRRSGFLHRSQFPAITHGLATINTAPDPFRERNGNVVLEQFALNLYCVIDCNLQNFYRRRIALSRKSLHQKRMLNFLKIIQDFSRLS